MYRKRGKSRRGKDKGELISSKLNKDIDYVQLKSLYNKLKKRYDTSIIFNNLEKKELKIPISIFSRKLSSLETISKYLKENLDLSYKKIADMLNRSEKTIWQAHNSSKKKLYERFEVKFSEYYIPTSIIKNRSYSVLESIVKYLKDSLGMRYHKIALLVERDDRTIWTVYHRANKKGDLKIGK